MAQNHELNMLAHEDHDIAHDNMSHRFSHAAFSSKYFMEALKTERSLMRNRRQQNFATI
jgi:hypothetical protein